MVASRVRRGRAVGKILVGLLFVLGITGSSSEALSADDILQIPDSEARHHLGEVVQVCGRVASAAHITTVKGEPTFINFGRPYPDQIFTAVIWGKARALFEGAPEKLFDGKSICVTGEIETYRGKPQIVVEDPGQIVMMTPEGEGEVLTDLERIFVKSLLASLGHDTDYGTGEWDHETVEALVAFQEDAGVPTTGDPDAATLRALAGYIGEIPEDERTMVIRLFLFELVRRQE